MSLGEGGVTDELCFLKYHKVLQPLGLWFTSAICWWNSAQCCRAGKFPAVWDRKFVRIIPFSSWKGWERAGRTWLTWLEFGLDTRSSAGVSTLLFRSAWGKLLGAFTDKWVGFWQGFLNLFWVPTRKPLPFSFFRAKNILHSEHHCTDHHVRLCFSFMAKQQ